MSEHCGRSGSPVENWSSVPRRFNCSPTDKKRVREVRREAQPGIVSFHHPSPSLLLSPPTQANREASPIHFLTSFYHCNHLFCFLLAVTYKTLFCAKKAFSFFFFFFSSSPCSLVSAVSNISLGALLRSAAL